MVYIFVVGIDLENGKPTQKILIGIKGKGFRERNIIQKVIISKLNDRSKLASPDSAHQFIKTDISSARLSPLGLSIVNTIPT